MPAEHVGSIIIRMSARALSNANILKSKMTEIILLKKLARIKKELDKNRPL